MQRKQLIMTTTISTAGAVRELRANESKRTKKATQTWAGFRDDIRARCQLEYQDNRLDPKVDDNVKINTVIITGEIRKKYFIRNEDGGNGEQVLTREANTHAKRIAKKKTVQKKILKKKEEKQPEVSPFRIRFINTSVLTPPTEQQQQPKVPRIRFINTSVPTPSTEQKQTETSLKRERGDSENDEAIAKRQKRSNDEHTENDTIPYDDSLIHKVNNYKSLFESETRNKKIFAGSLMQFSREFPNQAYPQNIEADSKIEEPLEKKTKYSPSHLDSFFKKLSPENNSELSSLFGDTHLDVDLNSLLPKTP